MILIIATIKLWYCEVGRNAGVCGKTMDVLNETGVASAAIEKEDDKALSKCMRKK